MHHASSAMKKTISAKQAPFREARLPAKQAARLVSDPPLILTGGRPLCGEVAVRGAKNSVPKNLVAALLSREPSTLHNIPAIEDVDIVSGMIRILGGSMEQDGAGTVRVTAETLSGVPPQAFQSLALRSRIPILFAGPLLARLGEAFIPVLGGCEIGLRPVNYHLGALEKLGATVREVPHGFHMTAKRLVGNKIHLEYPSVGATEQVLLAAVLAEGVTELSNAAIEPEIIDLIALLQKMGAIIAVDTDRVITIRGVPELHGYEHTAMTDRLEVASWAVAAAVTGGDIFVRNARQLDLMTFLNTFRQLGGVFEVKDDGIRFSRGRRLSSVAVETDVHPGFMTDWQQPFTILLTQAEGASIVHETVYENRFGYVSTLQAMGAKIQLYRECLGGKHCRFGQRNHLHSAVVMGPTPLHGADITIPDLRAGFSYVIAALAAEGVSTVRNMQVIRRGYEHFIEKLKRLGANVS